MTNQIYGIHHTHEVLTRQGWQGISTLATSKDTELLGYSLKTRSIKWDTPLAVREVDCSESKTLYKLQSTQCSYLGSPNTSMLVKQLIFDNVVNVSKINSNYDKLRIGGILEDNLPHPNGMYISSMAGILGSSGTIDKEENTIEVKLPDKIAFIMRKVLEDHDVFYSSEELSSETYLYDQTITIHEQQELIEYLENPWRLLELSVDQIKNIMYSKRLCTECHIAWYKHYTYGITEIIPHLICNLFTRTPNSLVKGNVKNKDNLLYEVILHKFFIFTRLNGIVSLITSNRNI